MKLASRALRVVPLPLARMARLKHTQPVKKQAMLMRLLAQPYGFDSGWLEAPRPRKTVLPVCMLMNVDHALYATESMRPEMRQQTKRGMEACCVEIV